MVSQLVTHMSSKFLLIPHNVFPCSHRLGQSDAIRKLLPEVFDSWQAIPLQEYLQCIHKPGTKFNGSVDSTLDSYHAAIHCSIWPTPKNIILTRYVLKHFTSWACTLFVPG